MSTNGRSPREVAALSLAVWLVLMVPGCGSGGATRLPVAGRVSGNGAETLDGSISFIPAKGNDGLGATSALRAGAYKFDSSNGPSAGSYDVSIRRTPSKPTGRPQATQRQEWTFKAEVPAAGPYTIDFTLD